MPPDPPGLAIHVGPGSSRDALERTSRLAAAAGISRQRTLPGVHAGRTEVIEDLRRGAAGLDPRGHLLLAGVVYLEQSDAGTASLTTIGTGDAPKHGALFLITGQI